MQSEMISQREPDAQATADAAKNFRCEKTGHDGGDPSKWAPSILTSEEAYQEHMQRRRKPGAEAARSDDPLRNEFVCYVMRTTAADHSNLGFGIHLENARSGALSSEFEWLSHGAFLSGTRHSTTNKPFELWLPIHITDNGWDEKLFEQNVRDIAKAACLRGDHTADSFMASAVLHICSSLMTNALVSICKNAEKHTANDRFIKGFFALYRLMHRVADRNTDFLPLVERQCQDFIEKPGMRTKHTCPNLGALLVSLIMSRSYTWRDIAQAFQVNSVVE
jgi:hypothetical protein